MGGVDEYAESAGGGNDTVRTDFQLSLRIEAAHAASVRFYNTFDTFSALYSSRQRNIMDSVGGMDMDYMTLKEASEKWGVSARQINYYCTAGRIPGAVKMATIWLIPKEAEKPVDRRRKAAKQLTGEQYD